MSAFNDINIALNKRLQAYSTANSRPIAYENIEYKPVIGTMFLRATALPPNTEQAGLGTGGLERHEGIFQVDVFAPIDRSKATALAEADSIANYFQRGSTLTYNGVNVRLYTSNLGPGLRDGSWFILPVFIDYLSYTQAR